MTIKTTDQAGGDDVADMKGVRTMTSDKSPPVRRTASSGKREYRTLAQPLEVVQDDDALLRLDTACALAGVSKPMLYRMIRAGRMPPLVKIGRGSRLRAGPFKAALAELGKVAGK